MCVLAGVTVCNATQNIHDTCNCYLQNMQTIGALEPARCIQHSCIPTCKTKAKTTRHALQGLLMTHSIPLNEPKESREAAGKGGRGQVRILCLLSALGMG